MREGYELGVLGQWEQVTNENQAGSSVLSFLRCDSHRGELPKVKVGCSQDTECALPSASCTFKTTALN